MEVCDNCTQDHNGLHLCRASESTCVDGKDCPDYVENCACTECWEGENDGTSEVQQ